MDFTFEVISNIAIFVLMAFIVPLVKSSIALRRDVDHLMSDVEQLKKDVDEENKALVRVETKSDDLLVQVAKIQVKLDMIAEFPGRMSER